MSRFHILRCPWALCRGCSAGGRCTETCQGQVMLVSHTRVLVSLAYADTNGCMREGCSGSPLSLFFSFSFTPLSVPLPSVRLASIGCPNTHPPTHSLVSKRLTGAESLVLRTNQGRPRFDKWQQRTVRYTNTRLVSALLRFLPSLRAFSAVPNPLRRHRHTPFCIAHVCSVSIFSRVVPSPHFAAHGGQTA